MSTLRTDYLESLDTGRSIEVDNIADQATTYTETEVDGLLDAKANISGQIFTGEINYRGASGDTTNSGYGENVLQNNTTGNENTANGTDALPNNTTGNGKTANGYNTGEGIYTGSGNSIFGANVTRLAHDLTDNLILASGGVIRLQHDGVGTTTVQGDLVADNLSGTNTGDQTLSEIGVGQTWQIVSRASGVTYTNTTGKPITAAVSVTDSDDKDSVTAFVDATRVIYNTNLYSAGATFTFIIPAGSTYKSDYSPNILESWVELR